MCTGVTWGCCKTACSDSGGSRWGLKVFISNKLPGDAKSTGPRPHSECGGYRGKHRVCGGLHEALGPSLGMKEKFLGGGGTW